MKRPLNPTSRRKRPCRMPRIAAAILLTALTAIAAPKARADEGMWLPSLIGERIDDMRAKGFRLTAEDIYSVNEASMKDAVVLFNGGCTGELISPEGLLVTNHHCGYGAIQGHSTVEHDYLTHGFWARDRSEELPNEGLWVRRLVRMEEVTDRLAAGETAEKICEEAAEKGRYRTAIEQMYYGNQQFLFVYEQFDDVRLVGAPPSSIGKFGGDTDNWMWPRHTGDFSVFRVYADKNGNPAPYSETNVPLHPKRWMKISIKGFQENDFAMIMGFPGRTNKYYTSWEVAERRDIDNAVRINIRELRQKAMLEEMLKDPKVRIQYASKYASSENAYKNSIGSNWAINKRNFEQVKRDEQEALLAWGKKECQPQYEEALLTLEQIVSDRKDLRFRKWMLDEAIVRGIEFTSVPTDVDTLITALTKDDQKGIKKQLFLLSNAFRRFYDKDYAPEVDRKIAKVMLKEYRRLVPTKVEPAYFANIDKKYKGDVDKFVDELFEKSIFGSQENFSRFIAHPTAKELEQDPMIQFALSVKAEQRELNQALKQFDDGYNLAHRTYVEGLLRMNKGEAQWPDANFTLRLTYGQIKGYSPRDCDYYGCQTTLDGVMEKEDSTNWEFVVPQRLKDLYAKKDFGPYAAANGKMPVALCATTHTTGGNSGSPVMNAEGELIGINFDRNWEGVGGDIEYLPDYQRSIIVDIRYVLFLIDKYAGADYLLKEMEIVK